MHDSRVSRTVHGRIIIVVCVHGFLQVPAKTRRCREGLQCNMLTIYAHTLGRFCIKRTQRAHTDTHTHTHIHRHTHARSKTKCIQHTPCNPVVRPRRATSVCESPPYALAGGGDDDDGARGGDDNFMQDFSSSSSSGSSAPASIATSSRARGYNKKKKKKRAAALRANVGALALHAVRHPNEKISHDFSPVSARSRSATLDRLQVQVAGPVPKIERRARRRRVHKIIR